MDINSEWDVVARHGYEAPWVPYSRTLPKHTRSIVPIREGEPYSTNNDPLPVFTWCTIVSQRNDNAQTEKKSGFFRPSRLHSPFSRKPVPVCRPLPLPVFEVNIEGVLGLELEDSVGIAVKRSLLLRLKRCFR